MSKKIFAAAVLIATALILYKSNDSETAFSPEITANKSAAVANTKLAKLGATTLPDSATNINQKIEEFFSEIPKLNSLRHATAHEVHVLPAAVRDAGQYLSEMREYFVKYPQSAAVEMGFYLKCANDAELFDSVRAICAARTGEKYQQLTGRKISPLVFGKRIGDLQRYVKL